MAGAGPMIRQAQMRLFPNRVGVQGEALASPEFGGGSKGGSQCHRDRRLEFVIQERPTR